MGGAALIALCAILFYWAPMTSPSASIQWDAADMHYPLQKYFSDRLLSGKLPFWTPYLFVVPLNPPTGLIPLADPFVQFFGSGRVPTRDLFFSGHVSTLFLLSLCARNKVLKLLFLALTLTVAVVVLWQHVHYTIDVMVAPFVAYASYRMVTLAHDQLSSKNIQPEND